MATPNSTPRITIEAATLSDAEAISTLGRETFTSSFGSSMDPKDLRDYLNANHLPEIIAKEMTDPSNTLLLAREQPTAEARSEHPQDGAHDEVASTNGNVIGFLQLKYGATEPFLPAVPLLELHRIYISTTSISRKTGKLLVEAAHTMAVTQGFKGIHVVRRMGGEPTCPAILKKTLVREGRTS